MATALPPLVRPQPHFYDMPPSIKSAPLPDTQHHADYQAKEEEHSDELGDDGNNSDDQYDSATGAQRKGRRGANTAEKRANHNAIERARRENLNGRFMELADALPTINANKRPSKNTIVIKALEFVQGARLREQALESQNASLRAEVNDLRSKLGMPPIPATVGQLTTGANPIHGHGRLSISHGHHVKPQPDHHRQGHYPVGNSAQYPHVAQPQPVRHLQLQHPQQQQQQPHSAYGAGNNNGPYLPQDPIAAAYYGFVGGIDPARRPSLGGSSATETGSESDASLVHTPPQLAGPFPSAANFHYDDHAAAPRGLVGMAPPASSAYDYPSCSGAGSLPSISALGGPLSGGSGGGGQGWSSLGGAGYPGGGSSAYQLYA